MGEGKTGHSSRGIGLLTTVQIVFLILYFTDTGKVAEWPLVYVLMPLIIQGALLVLACCCMMTVLLAGDKKNNPELPM